MGAPQCGLAVGRLSGLASPCGRAGSPSLRKPHDLGLENGVLLHERAVTDRPEFV